MNTIPTHQQQFALRQIAAREGESLVDSVPASVLREVVNEGWAMPEGQGFYITPKGQVARDVV